MKKNWKIAGAALLIAIAVPVTAYAADNMNGKATADLKKESSAVQKSTSVGGQDEKRDQDKGIKLDVQEIAASKLGLDQSALEQAVKDGESLADIAKEKGIELQPLIVELTQEIIEAINLKRGSEEFTSEEQENVKKKASMEAERIFTMPLNKEQDKQDGSGGMNIQAAFELIGIDKAEFAKEVQAGKTFADIAKDHGVSRQQLIDALMSDVNDKITEVQANGDITKEQADQKKQAVMKDVETFVDQTQTVFEKKQ
ncbi:hypothetical protein PALU110988_22585 [Paenibacillus lupini]|uniref:hypothetical protein n=1 Tax=Paenibacillus lupini TaxID=1450204 RepID=UPI001423A4D4|nr:hypothetical protein [Paenibacillus lupini]NIK22775.1 uncharacterized protein YidB (DUF937 family) [Paenibacillus lupini]